MREVGKPPADGSRDDTPSEMARWAQTENHATSPLRVLNVVLHMDEATPHIYIDFAPVATKQTSG